MTADAVLSAHGALVNADLCREVISLTQQLEQLKIRHRFAACYVMFHVYNHTCSRHSAKGLNISVTPCNSLKSTHAAFR